MPNSSARWRFSLGLLGLAAASCLLGASLAQAGTISLIEKSRWVQVSHVYDGDTFRTVDGEKVRLLGINAPEIAHNDEPGEPLGMRAQRRLKEMIAGRIVRLRFDKQQKDSYGRTLAQVYLRDGEWVNARLVREGLAHVYTFPPNFRWTQALLEIEEQARRARRGIWKTTRFRDLKAEEISPRHIGQFRILHGEVRNPHRWRFRLGRVYVTVPGNYRRWFEKPLELSSGQRVRLRGVIRSGRHGALYLALHSPYDLEILGKE